MLIAASGSAIEFSGINHAAASAPPNSILQSVDLNLSDAGAIDSVATHDIARSSDGFSTTTHTLAPRSVQSNLPVQVRTSYLDNGVPGTDPSALAGHSGLVEVDVTVSNATLHPQQVTYSVGGRSHTSYALVGAPLTVAASATLPKNTVGSVVTSTTGAQESHTTNGVVSQAGNGDSVVQWAALLAPPQGATTTTFRLVEQAKSFHMPSFTMSVTPGLTTDPSLQTLIDSAFGSSQSLNSLQDNTISLVSQVDTSLRSVVDTLNSVHSDLRSQAGQLGSNAKGTLTEAGNDLTDSSQQLSGALQSLQGAVSAKVTKSQDAATASLSESVKQLTSYLGLPAHAPTTAPKPSATSNGKACVISVAKTAAHGQTLFDRLRGVSQLLVDYGASSGHCLTAVRSALDSSVGALTASLQQTSGKLGSVADGIGSTASSDQNDFDTSFGPVSADLSGLSQDLSTVTTEASGISGTAGGGNLGGLASDLTALTSALTNAASDSGALGSAITTINQTASDEVNSLGSTSGSPASGSALDQLQTLTSQICGLSGVSPATLDGFASEIVGTSCAGTSPSGGSLLSKVTKASSDWQQIAQLTASGGSAAAATSALSTDLSDAATAVNDVERDLPGGIGDIGPDLTQLVTNLKALTSPASPYATLNTDLGKVQSDEDARVKALGQNISGQVTGAAGDVTAAAGASNTAKRQADTQLGSLLGTLSGDLSSDAASELTQSYQELQAQQKQLQQTSGHAQTQLQSATAAAIASLTSSITAADKSNTAASKTLSGEMSDVLIDLGSAGSGNGLLGDVAAQAGNVATGGSSVANTTTQVSGFRGVQQADLASDALTQAVVQQALQAVQALPGIGSMPSGVQHHEVFIYHLQRI